MTSMLEHDIVTLVQDLRLLRLAVAMHGRETGSARARREAWNHTGQQLLVHAVYVCRLVEEQLDGAAQAHATALMDAVTGIQASQVAGGSASFEAVDEAARALAKALAGRVAAWVTRSLGEP